MKKLLLTLVLTVMCSSVVYAAKGEASLYVEHCKAAINFSGKYTPNATEAMNIGFCFGLMDGLRGGNHFLKKVDREAAFCEPSTFDKSDLAKAFVLVVNKNPQLKELRGALAAQIALIQAFPCEKDNK